MRERKCNLKVATIQKQRVWGDLFERLVTSSPPTPHGETAEVERDRTTMYSRRGAELSDLYIRIYVPRSVYVFIATTRSTPIYLYLYTFASHVAAKDIIYVVVFQKVLTSVCKT